MKMSVDIDDISERRLVEGIARRADRDAMECIYRHYVGYLTGVCARYLSDADAIKDVLQESFLRVFSSIGRFEYRGPGALKAWMVRIVVNESLKALSRQVRFNSLDDIEAIGYIAEDIGVCDEPTVKGIPDAVIHRCISELPVGYRTILNLYVFEGCSHRDIAAMLGIKESTSASQFHRAKAMLAKKLNEYRKKNA